ncbi:MAG: histidine kinase dimerization/phospho-acceptor domain-containing protein, partial [Pseudomonadales bacterium]|nr:histidine kinase dimerization/phospho-acceptor domain-containing protein [Pseudomonadales bacterium]
MSWFSNIRGPRIGTKLMLLGVTLLLIPLFSYRQLIEMERLLIQGQSHAQLLTAEGISTLFNGRDDLFNDLPVASEDFESLFAQPLESAVRLDGDVQDWGDEDSLRQALSFNSGDASGDGSFELLLGERGGQLYVWLNVTDPDVVFRNTEYLRLDRSDHVRLSFIQADGEDGNVSLVFQEIGVVTAYLMDAEWQFAAAGTPDNRFQGHIEPNDTGWSMEFRLPLDALGSRRYFGISVVDVDDDQTREIIHNVQTLPTAGKESFNLVVLRSPQVRNIIEGLGYSGARILVIDAQKRVRAETGTHLIANEENGATESVDTLGEWFDTVRPYIHEAVTGESWVPPRSRPEESGATADQAIDSSLTGDPIALRRSVGDTFEIIMAAHPIVSRDEVIGTVVVEQNIDEILSFQRSALEQVILLSIVSLFAVFIALLGFAGRLAWRIRNLRREASAAIDQHGRLRTSTLRNEIKAGDELGDLARSVSNMLSKLHQHNQFLENMPRTLRHEINNPLNTLSTSLQNLAEENPEVRDSKYLESAKRGVIRIGSIVQNLADAANLEEALEAEELEVVDIQQLLANYIANCQQANSDVG